MRTLYVVRHAEPAVTGTCLGWSDPPLSDRGRAQAQVLGSYRVEVVYGSPLRRALETAEFVAAPLVVVPELKELGLGDWDGLRWDEIEAANPALAGRKLDDWFGVTPPGGETWSGFESRVRRALDRIRTGPAPAMVLAHSAVNSVLVRELAGVDPAVFMQQYCEVLTHAF